MAAPFAIGNERRVQKIAASHSQILRINRRACKHIPVRHPVNDPMVGLGEAERASSWFSPRAWYSYGPGMLGQHHSWRVRNAVAAFAAFLLFFAPVAPLAASVFSDPICSCCRSHGECCCKKTRSTRQSGPILANRSCSDGCRQVVLGTTATDGVVRPSTITLRPPAQARARLAVTESTPNGRGIDCILQQRPPPSPLS